MPDKKLQKQIDKKTKSIKQLLAKIEKQTEAYQDVDNPHWGHAGDLAEAESQLENIRQFLTNFS